MENQKQKKVELISFQLENHRVIKAVKLDFDKWKSSNVLEVVGDMGNGKSTLLEGLETATTGVSHIKDKDLLELGFKSEVQLADGDHKVFLGVKVSEISKGARKGEPKFETYIYEKDIDGKLVKNPVIDGKSATAKEYTDLLSTALSFRMEEMFSENQTVHRNLITELFAKELNELGVDELLESIKKKRKTRDDLRFECERSSAFKDHFKTEGYSETSLEKLKRMDIDSIDAEIETLKVDRGVLIQNPEKDKEVKLGKIREDGRKIVDDVRALNEEKQSAYQKSLSEYNKKMEDVSSAMEPYDSISTVINERKSNFTDKVMTRFQDALLMLKTELEVKYKINTDIEEPKVPDVILIESGKMQVPDMIPTGYEDFVKKYNTLLVDYKKESEKETFTPDTKDIDSKIEKKESEKKVAGHNNSLVDRFELWKSWIEAKGIYEKEVDTLRKLYTKIDTGVDGLFIQPHLTDSGKLEIWIEYDGSHDSKLFKNTKKELRRLYEYSKSQRSITGVLLQAARLDKKEKALRLCVLDDYTQTKSGKALLEKICREKDLKLIISKTSDEYDLKNLGDATFAIENGEILLG